jgi:hypothetical protein
LALETLEQLKASFAVVSDSTLMLVDKTSIIVRPRVHQRLRGPTFIHG